MRLYIWSDGEKDLLVPSHNLNDSKEHLYIIYGQLKSSNLKFVGCKDLVFSKKKMQEDINTIQFMWS